MKKVTFEEWVGFVSVISGEKMTRKEAGKFRKHLAVGEWSRLVQGYVRRDEAEKKASDKLQGV